jgi:hypothetical protein
MSDEQAKGQNHFEDIKEQASELYELEQEIGIDWAPSMEDLELLWNLREAFARSVEKGELTEPAEPVKEFESLDRDAELLLAEIDDSLETNPEKKEEKVENAERPL